MKIAFLRPMDSQVTAWSMTQGVVDTLIRMGFEVVDIPLPTIPSTDAKQFKAIKDSRPTIDVLAKCDAIITSGPEHIAPWMEAIYERYPWRELNVPTAAWLHESSEREDYMIDFEKIQWIAKDWFFPAIQDAEKYDQEMFVKEHSHYLPFGVDTHMFNHPSRLGRYGDLSEWDIAFIGLLYPKRMAFLKALSRHEHPPIRLGAVSIQDLRGYDNRGSVERYVENLRKIKVFFNLPSLSRLLVTKMFEVMACGGFLMTPLLPPEGGVGFNMKLFENGKHCIFYRASNTAHIAQLLREWSSKEKDAERDAIADAGFREVHQNHGLEKRLTQMLTTMGIEVRQAVQ